MVRFLGALVVALLVPVSSLAGEEPVKPCDPPVWFRSLCELLVVAPPDWCPMFKAQGIHLCDDIYSIEIPCRSEAEAEARIPRG